jgi:hypothetical protein
MENREFPNFNINEDKLLENLVNENLLMKANLQVLLSIFKDFFIAQGWSEEKFDNMYSELHDKKLYDLVEEHPYLPEDVKEQVKKSIPGQFNLKVVKGNGE